MYQGKKVLLRALDNSDLMASLDHMNDYETMRGVTSGLILPSNVDDEARFFSAQSRSNRGEYQFAIETLEGRRYIGRCGLNFFDITEPCLGDKNRFCGKLERPRLDCGAQCRRRIFRELLQKLVSLKQQAVHFVKPFEVDGLQL